jgi:two-component system nitrate/nitrite response regulator NarL
LIVDDHASFRTTARALLEAEGYEVVGEAADGAAALSLATRVRPDLVLLDVQLPDADGFEVAKRLAQLDQATQIILISTRAREDFAGLIDSSPARGFLSKAELSASRIADLIE